METSKKLLGYRRKKKEEWIKSDTWTTIDERKATKKKLNDAKSQRLKEQLQSRYSELDKEVKRKTRADKRAFIENLADEAEAAAQTQNMATLYKITKTLTGGFKNSDIPVKDVDGNVVTCEVKQTQRWKTHFETILNKCATICGGIMESYQKHMPDAGSFPKQVPQEDTANLLAEQNLQHGSP